MDASFVAALPPCTLFAQIVPADLQVLLCSMEPVQKAYGQGQVLLWAGEETASMGLVLQGNIIALKHTADGEEFPITHMGAGGIFGDVLSASSHQKSPVTVRAQTPCSVLWLPFAQMLAPQTPTPAHTQLMQNLIALLAQKYFALDRRVDLLLRPSLREKVLHYLQTELVPSPNGARKIPGTRAAMAAYLGCERSALCRELSKMQRDGILRIEKRSFYLLD